MNLKLNYKIKLSLVLSTGIVLFLLYYFINPIKGDFFPECIIHRLTGFYCTGCGTQRTLHYLLHLEIGKALHYNPLVVVLFPFLIYLIYIQLYNFIFNKQLRVKILYNNTFVVIFFALLLLYTVLRNIPCKPFSFLAPASL